MTEESSTVHNYKLAEFYLNWGNRYYRCRGWYDETERLGHNAPLFPKSVMDNFLFLCGSSFRESDESFILPLGEAINESHNSICCPVETIIVDGIPMKVWRGGADTWSWSMGSIEINVNPDDEEIWVGVGVGGHYTSYVNLSPSLLAGMRHCDDDYNYTLLSQELENVNWSGKKVTLAADSTIATHADETYAEFLLARHLRNRGAKVDAVRLHSPDGKIWTISDFHKKVGIVQTERFNPPTTRQQGKAEAEKAFRVAVYRAAHIIGNNRSLSESANFVRSHNIVGVPTKEMVALAARNGISRSALRSAVRERNIELGIDRVQ